MKIEFRVSEAGGAYSAWQEITGFTASSSYSKSGVLAGTYDYTKQAVVQIRATDKVYTVSNPIVKSITVAKGIPMYNHGENFMRVNVPFYIGSSLAIESGSNANGNWVRYADGTQICYRSYAGSIDGSTLADTMYQSATISWTFPVSFNDTNIVVVGSTNAINGYVGNLSGLSTTLVGFKVISSRTFTGRDARVMAIGRWK